MHNKKVIKVCGMREGNNIRQVEQLGANLIGLIFYTNSSRYVTKLPSYMPVNAKVVGVFVNATIECIKENIERFNLSYVQLHGNESAQFCREVMQLGVQVIKAISVASREDIENLSGYKESCNLFVFDTKCEQYGGSGRQFNWEILKYYNGSTPFLLSGGIGIESIEKIREFSHPMLYGYDLNSRFESEPGVKNCELIELFIKGIDKIY